MKKGLKVGTSRIKFYFCKYMMKNMGKRKVTLQDIANAMHLTPSAVSKALNDHPRMSDDTKAAVKKMAKKLNYKPNQLAAALRSGRSKLIGVVVPAVDFSFFSSVIKGIEETVMEAGYRVLLAQSGNSEQKEQEVVETLLDARVDGLIVSIGSDIEDFSHLQRVKEQQIPLILFDRVLKDFGVSTVELDDFKGAYEAVTHLINQGCRRIAHLAGSAHLELYANRIAGYKAALSDAAIPVREDYILNSELLVEDGRNCMEKLLKLPIEERPDALFCASDFSAVGALQILRKNKICVPKELKIVGFSNEDFTLYLEPAISTVDQASIEMGHCAGKLILRQLRQESESFVPQRVVLEPTLIIRNSSKNDVD